MSATPPATAAAGGPGTGAARERSLISLRGLMKVYLMGDQEVRALDGVDLEIEKGEFVAIMGPSGSGKSTLMNLIGCLDTPSSGIYELRGQPVAGMNREQLAEIRNRRVGFVFQNFNLLPQITAYENVEMPMLFGGLGRRQRRKRVEELMERVGLAERMHHKPTELSGGQMQRVAVARALAMNPDILLADEPTGTLDSSSGGDIMELFQELWESGRTMLVITHDAALARRAPRQVEIRDGLIVRDSSNGSPDLMSESLE